MNLPFSRMHLESARGLRRSSTGGSVLVVTMVFCALVGMVLLAYLTMVKSQYRFTHRAQTWNDCIPLCEAGIEEALAHLNHSDTKANFAINGWGLSNGAYRKERALSGGTIQMAIDTLNPPNITVIGLLRTPAQSNYLARTVRVRTMVNYRFPQALLSKGNVVLSGNTAKIDSYNSADPLESTLGQYDPLKADDEATVGTTSSTATFDVGNVSVYGKVATGPGGTVTISPSGSVGDTLWNSNPLNDGKIQPGAFTDDVNVYVPDTLLPTPFAPVAPAGGTVNGTNYTYVLGNGDYFLNSVNLGGSQKILVNGNARIHVQGQTSISGQAYILIANGGNVEWYSGNTVSLGGGGVVNSPGLPKNFSLIGLNTCTSVSYSGNSKFVGTIYAPKATVNLSGTADACGAMVGASINISGGMSFHYDEALRGNPLRGRFVAASWEEL